MSDETTKKNLLLLFDRPQEPVFVGKGENNKSFDVPSNFLTERYQPLGVDLASRFGGDNEKIPVKSIALPDLSFATSLGRNENFSLFLPKHREIAGRLVDIFTGVRNIQDLQSVAVFARDRVNPYMFNYCLSVAILHREDTQGLDLPSFVSTFPDKYMDSRVFQKAREEAAIVPEGSRMPIEIPRDYTASDLEEEHRIAYFREDLGINLHHWHWHLVYPFSGSPQIVRKDRRGELFYYMHQQILARYNAERFSNKLPRVERLTDLRKPIKEAYFPKLDSLVASRSWPSRVAEQMLQNLRRDVDQISADVDDLERWIIRIIEAVHQGYAVDERNNRIHLTELDGIDILGNMVESSILSPNRQLYGDLHNMGHVFIAYSHDPDHRHLESFGVMGDSATAMRDPVFYRWHAYVDYIFREFKNTLDAYPVARLNYQGVTVKNVSVQTVGQPKNLLRTYWQQSDVDLSRGMDFSPRGSVFARFTHLQHDPFTYSIEVNNQSSSRRGTCRIFLAPKYDEKGTSIPFQTQRWFMIELDKFKVNLKQGNNTITRRSDQSSVTIPFERTFRDLDNRRPTDAETLDQFNFCGCGWPQHMLIPRGAPEGMAYELFVMVSNINDDIVEQDLTGTCNDAESYCGVKSRLYPDRRAMGYPFDRKPRQGVNTLQQFMTPNMAVTDVNIKFFDRVIPRPN